MASDRVRAVLQRRRSNAAGPHPARRHDQLDDEPCTCGTGHTCQARHHDNDDQAVRDV
jgi:hypothetical protein